MLETVINFFNSRSGGEQAAMLIGAGIALHWAGIQLGALIGTLSR
ncbi:MAG: hypothetical protein ACK5JR_17220 [Tropicimonas sp.]